MRRARGLATALLASLPLLLAPSREALAQSSAAATAPPSSAPSLVVLTLDTESYGDQAEALSAALRSRVRASRRMKLVESQTSFAMFTGALACPEKPDAACLKKIAEQLKTDRFVWGTLSAGAKGEVAAEVHLWDHGKDTVDHATFSENLRDQNDEVLRRIAERILGALTSEPVPTRVAVHAQGIGDLGGTVRVDGVDAASIEHGQAKVDVAPGDHVVEARANGFHAERKSLHAVAGADVEMTFAFERDVPAPVEAPAKPVSARTILALSSLGVGVGFGVAGTIEAVRFLSRQAQNDDDHKRVDAVDFCDKSQPHTATDAQLDAACQNLKSGRSARLLEGVFYGISAVFIGTGAILLITGHDSANDTATSARRTKDGPRFSFSPYAAPHAGGADLALTF